MGAGTRAASAQAFLPPADHSPGLSFTIFTLKWSPTEDCSYLFHRKILAF